MHEHRHPKKRGVFASAFIVGLILVVYGCGKREPVWREQVLGLIHNHENKFSFTCPSGDQHQLWVAFPSTKDAPISPISFSGNLKVSSGSNLLIETNFVSDSLQKDYRFIGLGSETVKYTLNSKWMKPTLREILEPGKDYEIGLTFGGQPPPNAFLLLSWIEPKSKRRKQE